MKNDGRNYVLVGGFVVFVLALFIVWIAMISGRAGATDPYQVRYERVPGLKAGSQVLFQGHPIGFIDAILFDSVGRVFEVQLELEHGWPIPVDSVALIKASGLLSAVVIDIEAGSSQSSLPPGSTLPSREAADLFAAISTAAKQLNGLMGDEIQPLLESLRGAVPETMDSVQQLLDTANEVVAHVNDMLREENAVRFDRIVLNAERTSDQVATLMGEARDTRNELHEAIETLNAVVQDRGGDLDRSVSDLQRSLEAVALRIDTITASLEAASRDMAAFSNLIRRDPSLVLRGRARPDDPPEPP